MGSLVGLLGSPLVGWLMKKGVAPKTLVVFGLLLSGVTLTLHGFYKDLLFDSDEFFWANVATRFIHALGPVLATTAIYPIVAVETGDRRAFYLPLLEASYTIGLMIWPCIGAILYDNFGYIFPFVSVGLLAVVIALTIMLFLPKTKDAKNTCADQEEIGYDKVDFKLVLTLTNIAVCYLIIGFNDITLSVELSRYSLSHTEIGYCFAVATVCYGVFIYLWSFACRSHWGLAFSQTCGYVLTAAGLCLMGPSEFFLGSDFGGLTIRLTGQALLGVGLAALFTTSMLSGLYHITNDLDLPDDVRTHGFFSCLMFFSLCGGYLIGHGFFAGLLIDYLGYNIAVCAIIATLAGLVVLGGSHSLVSACSRRRTGYEQIGEDLLA